MSGAIRRAGRWIVLAALVPVVGAIVVGCANDKDSGVPVERGPAPTFEEVAARYNARVAGLDRLWARTTVRYWGYDAEDRKVEESGEGYLQMIRPRKLFFSVGKVGETGFELGSNDDRYWWIDVQNKIATVGEHARARPETLRRSGVPVHPLDLIEVLGVTELTRGAETRPRWTRDGRRLELSLPGRWGGTRVLYLDPERWEPVEIRLLDAAGELAVRAELSDYERIETPVEREVATRVATRVMISVPGRRSEIRVTLYDPENRGARMKERAFSLETLLSEYGVERERNLDAPVAGADGVGP